MGTIKKTTKAKTKTKSESIILRVDETMKFQISELASESRRELSDYLRLVIEDTIKQHKKV